MENESYIHDKFSIDELLHRSWKHKSSREFIKFFDFMSRFHHYSLFNTMLVYLQNEAVTFFGGTSFWRKKFKRTIKEDARPYVIMAPGGPVMMVYDIFETEGADTPGEFLRKGLGTNPFEVKGNLRPRVLENAISTAESLGIRIRIKPLSFFHGGSVSTIISGKLQITLKKENTTEQSMSVLMHELAHLFLGHTGHKMLTETKPKDLFEKEKGRTIKLPIRKLSATAMELEAESVSFLICNKLGLETTAAEYIASYIKSDDDLLQFSYETVIKTADKINSLFIMYEIK